MTGSVALLAHSGSRKRAAARHEASAAAPLLDELLGRILIVDDNARALRSMVDVLTAAGHDALGCASASEGLKQIERAAYDVIITDLQMPGMDGLAFIRALAERRVESQIVMVTAFASVASAVEAMRYGAFDYIEKPFDVEQLEALVARALRHGEKVGTALSGAPGGPRLGVDSGGPQSGDPSFAAADCPGGTDRRDGAHYRRKRDGEGTCSALSARGQLPRQPGTGGAQLPGAFAGLDGKRVVRSRAGCVHQRRRAAGGPL
jgi:CheY-like chemotaxis protein